MTWQVNDLIPWVKNMWRGRGGGNRREEKKREVRREERLIHWIDYPSEQSRAEQSRAGVTFALTVTATKSIYIGF